MATRIAARYISRRFSSGGKILGEEEKAAENVYIKKIEKEKLEKLAQKGPKVEEKPTTGSVGSTAAPDANPGTSTSGASTEKRTNYAAIAGAVAVVGALGWYLTGSKKKEDAHK